MCAGGGEEAVALAAAARARASPVLQEVTREPAYCGADLPILDAATLARTAASLKPDAVRAHLDTLRYRIEGLLRELGRQDATPGRLEELGADAHALAGSAGMFGFERLVFAARYYEREAIGDTSQADFLAAGLAHVLSMSLAALGAEACAACGEQAA